MARFDPAVTPSPRVTIADIIEIEEREGPRAAYAVLQKRVAADRDRGTDLPVDIARLEQRLLTECYALSQGR